MISAGLKRKLDERDLERYANKLFRLRYFFHPDRRSIFPLVFRFRGEEMVQNVFASFPGGLWSVSDSHACHFPVGLHSGLY